ncbi:MAG: sulfatase-like hydrolase/transferase [Alphaproteobacteria bacterium]|nr:sulfatase-like hydrolase/transferase [Alphaproteobacteria bacterium]
MQKKNKLTMHIHWFILWFSLLVGIVFNVPFFQIVWPTLPVINNIGMWFLVFTFLYLFYSLFFWPKVTKIFAALFILFGGTAFYFNYHYHIYITRSTVASLFETNFIEASDWIGLSFIICFLFLICCPIFLLYKINLKFPAVKVLIKQRLAMLFVWLLSGLIIGCVWHTDLSLYLKRHYNIRYFLVPTNYISSAVDLGIYTFSTKHKENTMEWVKKTDRNTEPHKKNLFVFVLGESARDANFSLTGYSKDTNGPLMPYAHDIIAFKHTQSCGTVTRVSVPCMFSHYSRKSYDERSAKYAANALDILQHEGIDVYWVDNELGCNKVCRHVPTVYTCTTRSCFDASLNNELYQMLPDFHKDTFVVLHQRGSHGPRYDLRTPKQYQKFQPICEQADLDMCSREAVVNSYDNSLYYTSILLADLMEHLSKLTDEYNPVLLYISDHGQSLGEDNLYGHGAEYEFAPAYQKEVPFFVWMPSATRKSLGLDAKCLQDMAQHQVSQDYIFHSILGLFGIATNVYDANLDIFSQCFPKLK